MTAASVKLAAPASRAEPDQAAATAAGTIEGYASVFYDGNAGTEYQLWDDLVERIMPGAFEKALTERQDVRGLFNHDPNQILGRTAAGTLKLSVDGRGLRYEITAGNTTVANDVREHLKRGDINGSSFSFNPLEENWIKKEQPDGRTMWIREIRSLDLFDVGPVTFPAYGATSALARAAEQELPHIRNRLTQHIARGKLPGTLAAYRARAVEVTEAH